MGVPGVSVRIRQSGRARLGGRYKEERRKKKGTSLRDLQLTDGRNSLEQEAKLVYAIRATRGYRNSNFSLKFQRVGVSPTLVISCLVAM